MGEMKWYTWAFYIFVLIGTFIGAVGGYIGGSPGWGTFSLIIFIIVLIFFISQIRSNRKVNLPPVNLTSDLPAKTGKGNTSTDETGPTDLPAERPMSPYEHRDYDAFHSEETYYPSSAPAHFTVSITTTVSEREPHAPANIPRVALPPAPSNGYLSCAKFQIKGRNPSTRRINTKYVVAHNEDAAKIKMQDLGLENPVISQVMPNRPATERQLEFAKDLGARFPSDVSLKDASSIIGRMNDHYYDERELEALSYSFAKYAQENDILFSTFAHPDELLSQVVYQLPKSEKLTLYICAISQALHDGEPINQLDPRNLTIYSRARNIASGLITDEGLMKSLDGRNSSDFLKPRKGTKIYNAIISRL